MNLDGTVRLADGDETLLLPRQAFRAFVAVVSYHDRLKDRIPVNTTEHFYGIVQTRSRDEPRARRGKTRVKCKGERRRGKAGPGSPRSSGKPGVQPRRHSDGGFRR